MDNFKEMGIIVNCIQVRYSEDTKQVMQTIGNFSEEIINQIAKETRGFYITLQNSE